MSKAFASLAIAAVLAPALALAQPVTGTVTVDANVTTRCDSGSVDGGVSTFALGVLIDTRTGLLLTNLAAPPKTLVGSFCNARSTISVSATRMLAQSFTGTPPSGFTDAIDYTATASGWTTVPASYSTEAANNPTASQTRDTPFTGPITVSIGGFAPVGGAGQRVVADPAYVGEVIVTLAVAS
jgi:hypothetical protein